MKLEHSLTPYTKINSRWIKDPNIILESIKLQENTGRTLLDKSVNKSNFLEISKAKETKAKINKWDLIKLKSICIANETIDKMKRTYGMGENIGLVHLGFSYVVIEKNRMNFLARPIFAKGLPVIRC